MRLVDDYLDQALEMKEDDFRAALPWGVLLCEPDTVADLVGPPKPTQVEVDLEKAAMPRWQRGARVPGNEVYYVVPLLKRHGSAAHDRILIGRTDQNDVVIPHVSLSRSHATIGLAEPIQLTDSGSRHGTWLGEQRLVAEQPVAIASGTRIRFGAVRTMYLSAVRFYEYCQARIVADQAQRVIDGAISVK
jgi:hypothetical protein